MEGHNLEAVLDALGRRIRELESDIRLHDMDSRRYRERIKELEAENGQLLLRLACGGTNNDKN